MRGGRSQFRSSSMVHNDRASTLSANSRLKASRQHRSTDKKILNEQEVSLNRTQKNFQLRKQQSNIDKELPNIKEVDYGDPSHRFFYLGRGNNHELVKRLLERRKIWIENNELPLVHFKWTQTTWGVKFYNLNKSTLCFNHFEFHRQITNKQHLIKNLINFCQANKLNAFDITPTTFIIDLTDETIDLSLNAFVKFFNHNMPTKMKPTTGQLKQYLYVPRFPALTNKHEKRCQGNFYCHPTVTHTFSSEKNYLWLLKPTFLNRGRGIHIFKDLMELEKLINGYAYGNEQQQKGQIKRDLEGEAEEVANLGQESEEEVEQAQMEKKQSKKRDNTPAKGSKSESQTKSEPQTTSQVKSQIKQPKPEPKPQISPEKPVSSQKAISKPNVVKIKALCFVVQKYIERPLLINNRKFDMRVWALVTHNLQLYFFKQGYIRTSCQQYNPQDLSNIYIHLTNNAIQKYSDKYEKYEFGNQLSFEQFEKMLQSQGYFKFKERILKKIKESILLSICAVKRRLNQKNRKYCFQIFGYDFLIDERMKTWLIEVNTNPCIEESSPLLGQLIPRMLDDAFKLTLDQIFPHNQVLPGLKVDGYDDDENMWELLSDLAQANKNTLKKRFTFVRR